MQPARITREIFRRSVSCLHKAYASARLIETGDNRLVSLMLSRAETVRQEWTRIRYAEPSMVETIRDRSFAYRDLEATVSYAEWVKNERAWSPFLFSGHLTISRNQRLELAYMGKVLSGHTDTQLPRYGYVVTSQKKSRVQLSPLYETVDDSLATLKDALSSEVIPPPRRCSHCSLCEYRPHCLSVWKETDSLDLMGPLSEKTANSLRTKGIETVHQLSLTYRPRKRGRLSKVDSVPYKPEIHALSLERNKVIIDRDLHLQVGDEVRGIFLDFEGLPDESFYYLCSILVVSDSGEREEQFWADDKNEEAAIFARCIERLKASGDLPIYHFGSYDWKVLWTLGKRNGVQCQDVLDRMVNVLGLFYGRVYFPVYTHGLKDLGSLFGAKWAAAEETPHLSGADSILWRYLWEEGENQWKDTLLTYCMEDCRALATFMRALLDIDRNASNMQGVSFSTCGQQQTTDRGRELHGVLDKLLLSGHSHYERSKVSFGKAKKRAELKRRKRRKPAVDKVIRVRRRIKCPRCGWEKVRPHPKKPSQKTIYDLEFAKSGLKRKVVMYTGSTVYCYKCKMDFPPKRITDLGKKLFSRNFAAWFSYNRVENRLPYRTIATQTREMFRVEVSKTNIKNLVEELGEYYEKGTRKGILSELLGSPFVGVDDTSIRAVDGKGYIWVITNGTYFAFTASHSREAKQVLDMLEGYEGVLVSDFFPGFDSAPFTQQKCWSHLIKDVNNGIWRNPFDNSMEDLGSEVSNLMGPIIEDARRFGLSKYHLKKHCKKIEGFYARLERIERRASIETRKLISRIVRYRQSLFTFLECDGIPWHNNASELGLRHIAIQRKISNAPFQIDSIHGYLALLGIYQTCRANGCSFLDFLVSGERDLVAYVAGRRGRFR